jgi:hypothetical protein
MIEEQSASSVTLDHGDVENQQNPQAAAEAEPAAAAAVEDEETAGDNGNTAASGGGTSSSFTRASKIKSYRASMNAKIGILALMDDEVVDENDNKGTNESTAPTRRAYIPFPSIDELSMHNNKWNNNNNKNNDDDDDDDDEANIEFDDGNQLYSKRNICPCRCLFFTLMETMCLVMSALGCAVFLAGLVALCLFLEGSYVKGDQ